MAARHIILLVAAACLSGAALSHAASLSDSENALPSDISSRVLNGYEASNGQFPHQAAILENKILICGGSIINHRDIVTAASCVTNATGAIKPLKNFLIGVGDINLNNYNDTNSLRLSNIWIHNSFNATTKVGNIALIRVNGGFQYSENVFPARIASAVPTSGELTISGWGAIWNSPLAPDMQHLYFVDVNRTTCTSILPLPTVGVFCGSSSTTDTCGADAGGPVIYNGTLVAIVSHSACRVGNPAVYTNIVHYTTWLESAVSGILVSGSARLTPGLLTSLLAALTLLWALNRRYN